MSAVQIMVRRSERWKLRLISIQESVRTHLESIDENELGWSPDVGIASIGEHIASICTAQWDLVRHLSGTGDGESPDPGMAFGKDELAASLQSSWRRISNWFAEAGPQALDGDEEPDVEDAMLLHMTHVAFELGASRATLQLIDPERELPTAI